MESYLPKSPGPKPSGLIAGEGFRDKAHAVLEGRRWVFVQRSRRALLHAMLAGDGYATADDVRAVVKLPAEIGPKMFGAVLGELADAGIIRADGFVKSTRPEAHARPVQRWRLEDREAAAAWLESHPEPAPPAEASKGDSSAPPELGLFVGLAGGIR